MEKVQLKNVCRPKQWKTLTGKNLVPDGKYPVYGANGIIGYYNDYNHENETLMIGCRGTCGALNISQPFSYINGNAMALDDLVDDIDIRYLYYALMGRGFQDVISGAVQPQIIRADLEKMEVWIGNKKEQKEIVDVFNKLDTVLSHRKREIQYLDDLIKARFVEMFGDNQEVHKLSDIAAITGGLTKNSRRDKLELRKPYLRVANVFFASIDTTEILDIGLTKEEYEKTLLRNGDLLFVEGNGSPDQIGRVAIWNGEIEDCVHQNHLIKARFDLKRMNPVFAMYYFISERGRNQIKKRAVSTSGLYTLSVSKIADFEIPNPPMELQQQFAAFVAAIDKSKATVQKALDETQLLFDSLMQQYFG